MPAAPPSASSSDAEPERALRHGAAGWILAWSRPITESRGREAESLFGAIDRLTGMVLGLLLGVTVFVVAAAALLSAFPGSERTPVHDGVGDGTRIVTLLHNPRRPPALVGATAASGSASPLLATQAAEDLRPLVDGRADAASPTWWTTRKRPPIDLQFAAGETGRGGVPIPIYAGRVLFAHAGGAPAETWAKEVEVWTSLTREQEELVPLGRWTLEQRAGPQAFSFPRRAVWGLTLRIHSNHGHATETTLAELALLGG